ncbi:unnamed protein product [Nezara viridula]|uniref:Uncharacterized protein n=1 Tax=Nezara viridula TaxID=85310 RepID=A0A9P0ML89_NEZVI|nr:unnamed protein product [Nezara viridula]
MGLSFELTWLGRNDRVPGCWSCPLSLTAIVFSSGQWNPEVPNFARILDLFIDREIPLMLWKRRFAAGTTLSRPVREQELRKHEIPEGIVTSEDWLLPWKAPFPNQILKSLASFTKRGNVY